MEGECALYYCILDLADASRRVWARESMRESERARGSERASEKMCVCMHVRWHVCVIPDFKGLYNGALADIGVVA